MPRLESMLVHRLQRLPRQSFILDCTSCEFMISRFQLLICSLMSNTYLGLWLIFCKLFCSHLSLRRAWKIWMNFQRGFFMSKIILGPLESSRVSDISLWVIFIRGIVNRYELDLRHSLRVTQTFSETIWLCLKIRCKVYYVLCVTTLGLLFLRRRVVNFSIFL